MNDAVALVLDPNSGLHRGLRAGEALVDSGGTGINLPLSTVLAAGNDADSKRIVNLAAPISDLDAATKKYVDDLVAANNDLDEILANGNDAGAQQIKNLADPTAAQDATTKAYVDALVAANNDLDEILTNGNDGGGLQIKNIADPTAAQDATTRDWVLSQITGTIASGTGDGQMLYWDALSETWQSTTDIGWEEDTQLFIIGNDVAPASGSEVLSSSPHGSALFAVDISAGEVFVNGKLTVSGLIDPTGLELTPQAANPGAVAANTIWLDSLNSDRWTMEAALHVTGDLSLPTGRILVGTGDSILYGDANSSATGAAAVALGAGADATADNTVAIGSGASATVGSGVAIGVDAAASASEATAVGPNTVASGLVGGAFGNGAESLHQSSYAIGDISVTTQSEEIVLGSSGVGTSGHRVVIPGTEAATGTTTGALRVAGGVGVTGDIRNDANTGTLIVSDSIIAQSNSAGGNGLIRSARLGGFAGYVESVHASGAHGWNFDGDVFVGAKSGNLRFSTASNGGNQSIEMNGSTGDLRLYSTTASTSPATGALVVDGGAGIAGDVYIGGKLTVTGETTFTGSVIIDGETTSPINSGTGDGQMAYWDHINEKWLATTDIAWEEDTQLFLIGDNAAPSSGSSISSSSPHSSAVFAVDVSGETVYVNGKLTVFGLIDPTGLQLDRQAANPGNVDTLWIDASGKFMLGATDVGTVTSVGLSLPAELTVSNSPVTTSGTISAVWVSAAQNSVFAGPTGAAGTPAFRGLVAGDIPNLDASKITTGILPIVRGGTNSGAALNNDRIMVSSGGAVVEAAALADGQLLIGSTGAAPAAAAITAGTGIDITNGAGAITVASTNAAVGAGSGDGQMAYWDEIAQAWQFTTDIAWEEDTQLFLIGNNVAPAGESLVSSSSPFSSALFAVDVPAEEVIINGRFELLGMMLVDDLNRLGIRLATGATNWIDFNYDPAALSQTGAGSYPDQISFASTTIEVAAFDPDAEESVSAVLELNHQYAEGTDISPHLHWYPTTTNTGTVVWKLEYTITRDGQTVTTSTTLSVSQAATDGVAWQMYVAEWGDIDGNQAGPGATPLQVGDQIHFRLFRDATNGSDTYTGDAAVATVGFHVEVNSFGSDAEFTKAQYAA